MAHIVFKLEDGTEIETELDSDLITVGRHPESSVILPSPSVSSHHATIKRRGDAYYVQDLGTTNGSKLNGVEVEEAKLEDGDRLTFGDVPATVHLKEAPARKTDVPPPTLPAKGPSKAPQIRRGYATTTYTQSSGCAGFLILLLFLSLAFIGGLIVRHAVEHKSFLVIDLIEKVRDKFAGSDSESDEKKPDANAGKTEEKKAEAKEAK